MRLLCALALGALLLAGPGCGDAASPEQRKGSRLEGIRLPRGAYPSHLYHARDGSLWITESGEAVARLLPEGKLRQYRLPGSENSPGDLEEGPEGAIWIVGFGEYIRIDPRTESVDVGASFGSAADPEVGFPTAVATGPDGTMWFATGFNSPSIFRVTSTGLVSPVEVDGDLGDFEVAGMALGADDAVWMTLSKEFGGSRAEIARLALDGGLSRWPLPGRRSSLGQIVSGPDDALWFTEGEDGIGRITTAGEISEYELRPGLAPRDIATGLGDYLWFTTDKRVGRITTKGAIETQLVPDAESLFGVAPAPGGGVWAGDGPADKVHYIEPF